MQEEPEVLRQGPLEDILPTLQSLNEDDWDAINAELCLRDLSHFVKEFWDTIVPNALVWNWHLTVLCDEIQASDERVFAGLPRLYDLIINVPPGTSKTKIISILSTAWEFARCPGIKVFVGSYSDMAVQAMADEIKLVMKCEKYQRYFPKTIIRTDRDSLHNFKTTENGEFYAYTISGTLTSKHADILKVDDPINPKETASEATIETTNNFFRKTLPTRKVDKKVTPTYLVMQRLHFNDPTGFLLGQKRRRLRHICLPATDSELVQPAEYRAQYVNGLLDPERLDYETLADMENDLGPEDYAGQFDQNPVPLGGLIWGEWFIQIPDHDFPLHTWGSNYGTDWDLAYTKKEKNAASCYFTTFSYRGRIYIDDFDFQWLEFPELIKWMARTPAPHYIEKKATGASAKQTLNNLGIAAIEVEVPHAQDKVARAKAATPKAHGGLVCIRRSLAERLYRDPRQGILFFPKGKYKDVADTLAQAILRHAPKGARVLSDAINAEEDILRALGY
jgi:phage terminase large subunit-like protein